MLSLSLVRAAAAVHGRQVRHYQVINRSLLKHKVAISQNSSNFYTNPRQMKDVQMDKETVMVRIYEPGTALPHQQWNMRANINNVYLSWCRNSYLCSGMAIAIMMSQKCVAPLPFEPEMQQGLVGVAHVLLVLSQLNMLYGSGEFLLHLYMTKNLTQISWITALMYTIFVMVHLYIFIDVFTGLEGLDSKDDDGSEV